MAQQIDKTVLLEARIEALERDVKALRALIAPQAPTQGTSGTITLDTTPPAPVESVPMHDAKIIGYVTPKNDFANVRQFPQANETSPIKYALQRGQVRGVKARTTGISEALTWYELEDGHFVRSDVVLFSFDKPVPAPPSSAKWPAPIVGYAVTNHHLVSGHHGIDLATGDRTPPILSSAAGYVVKAQSCFGCGSTPGVRNPSNNFGYANFVIVSYRLPDGRYLHCLYAHLSAIHVVQGSEIAANTVIGLVGSTGDSTGNHLHIEARVGPARDARWASIQAGEVDPALFFDL